jgi:C1A family cysteine protease
MRVLNIMIIMLVLIMSVGAVCATDSISDDITSDGNQEKLETTQDNLIVMGESSQSFSQLNNEIQNVTGNYLELNTDYKFNASSDRPIGIFIEKDNFVLDGKGHTIDADNQARVFVVNANNVTINNVNIINAYISEGSAFYINPNFSLTTNNVNINNCSSAKGVIYVNTNGTYTSNNDKITDVTASSSGAITLYEGNAIFNNILMTSSKALSWGFINSIKDSSITVLNSVFANTTSNYTTAIKGDKSVTIKNTKFINLHANFTAGAVSVKSSSNVIIDNCTFENVSSSKNGGALFVDAYFTKNMPVTVTNSTFVDCYSGFGGAILALGVNINIKDCNFTKNAALFDGGAIYSSFSNMNLVNSIFDSNGGYSSVVGRDSYGGAIYFDAGTLSMYDSKLINNFAQTGSAIYLYDSDYNIKNNEFNNNSNLNGTYNDIYTAFENKATLENNTYSGENTTSLNNKLYGTIIDIPGAKIELINNSIDVTTLPSKFDLRDWNWVTPVKDQGNMAACWAFSASAPLESVILRYIGISMSLSENNIQNIGLEYSKYGVYGMKETGIQTVAAAYALAWFGVFSSEYDAYDQLGKISPLIAPTSAIHFQDMIIIPARKNATDNNPIKEAVLKYGAVGVGYAIGSGPYINGSSQYCYDDRPLDHGVTIVGWDDNYPKEMFFKTPPGDGAWIIKNSWGEEAGDHGYYYISYYDVNFSTKSTACAFILNNTVQYDKNYQTDVMGVIKYANNSDTYMNKYKALDNDAIAAVGTYFNESGVEYTVEIYVNNVLKHTQNGVSPFYGFHTIQLDTVIPIKKGDDITAKIKSNSVPICTLSRVHYLENTSYYLINGEWKDPAAENETCVLKVYTVALPIYTEDLVKIYKNDSRFEANIGAANETVTFEINGRNYTRVSDENGTASIAINLNPGNYTIKTTYKNNTVENTITVLPTLIAEDLVKYYRNASQFDIALINTEGKPVAGKNITMNINGIFYNRTTNENGTARLNINLPPGEYILTAIDPLTGLQMSYTITVLSILNATDLVMKYNDGSTFNASVLDGQGNPLAEVAVTFNVNGIFYVRHTDSNGIARLNINLPSGEYIITSEYDGLKIANTITIKD